MARNPKSTFDKAALMLSESPHILLGMDDGQVRINAFIPGTTKEDKRYVFDLMMKRLKEVEQMMFPQK